MKNFTELHIKSCYESGVDNIVEDFYELVLSCSKTYDRIAGFFSSSSLALAARGMGEFILNGGKMRLICSPVLSKQDACVISDVIDKGKDFSNEISLDLDSITDSFERDHIKALGWMISRGLLEIKLAILTDEYGNVEYGEDVLKNGLFHQKIGLLTDSDGNSLSFSGSVNESASAWGKNDEEFKVFKAWAGADEYYNSDRQRFDDFWLSKRNNVKIFPLPQALKEKIIVYSKDFEPSTLNRKNRLVAKKFETVIPLFPYQNDALIQWKDNSFSQLFEMATGTGKTRTAIAGMEYLVRDGRKIITVVACPQSTLSLQWKSEIEKLNVNGGEFIVADGNNPNWFLDLQTLLLRQQVGMSDKVIVFTTHDTASSDRFTNLMKRMLRPNNINLFIGDEAHWLGAPSLRKALLPEYNYRIGLSATPSRWFDDEGTTQLVNYFGNNSFEFTIKQALIQVNPLTQRHFLVNYYYIIRKVCLNTEEMRKYKIETRRLLGLSSKAVNDKDAKESYQRVLERRAKIIKNADSKYYELVKILQEINSNDMMENIIIFVSPEQIVKVGQIIAGMGIAYHKLTQDEGTKAESRYGGISEREFIISNFKKKNYKVLIAIKCLDEGIDIPSASIGILMASNTNPREYVQRIGRIIRQDEGKKCAYLYDLCVSTFPDSDDSELGKLEKKIRAKEKIRMREIASNAINSADALLNIV